MHFIAIVIILEVNLPLEKYEHSAVYTDHGPVAGLRAAVLHHGVKPQPTKIKCTGSYLKKNPDPTLHIYTAYTIRLKRFFHISSNVQYINWTKYSGQPVHPPNNFLSTFLVKMEQQKHF